MSVPDAEREQASARRILVVNSGSSSVKFAVYDLADFQTEALPAASLRGALTGIGAPTSVFIAHDAQGQALADDHAPLADHAAALMRLLAWAASDGVAPALRGLVAIGHRVVHGGTRFQGPSQMNTQALDALRSLIPLAPNHLPAEIAAIEAVGAAWPDVTQIACFDTTFHQRMPAVARRFALPRRYADAGVVRYGFHGISFASICTQLRRVAGPTALDGRVIIAHLGSGASMVALRDGISVDTTMGLTPLGGLVMSTRAGDLDPGVMLYLAREPGMTPARVETVVGEQSGLFGVSAVSGDMRELLAREATDEYCAEAIESFCYAARKSLGALTAALGGVETLVFTGGIGERASSIRQRICDGLGYLGVTLATARNAAHASIISTDDSRVTVRVISTDEETMIARYIAEELAG